MAALALMNIEQPKTNAARAAVVRRCIFMKISV
jgi:hypothetical protein